LFTLCACFVDYAFVIVVIKESYYYYYYEPVSTRVGPTTRSSRFSRREPAVLAGRHRRRPAFSHTRSDSCLSTRSAMDACIPFGNDPSAGEHRKPCVAR